MKIGIEEKEEVLSLYSKGLSMDSISRRVGICNKSVKIILERRGIQIKRPWEFKRVNYFNENYFKTIDSKAKAYFLGLLYADGNVYEKRNRIQITLINEDRYLLNLFSEEINSEGGFYIDRQKYTKLILDSKKMFSDLVKLGCVPRKSLILKFPTEDQVPRELLSHFIRGFFDGDGSVCPNNERGYTVSFTSSEPFLLTLSTILKENLNLKVGKFRKRYKDKENSAGQIYTYERCDNPVLFNYLYSDCGDFFMRRKKDKFIIC